MSREDEPDAREELAKQAADPSLPRRVEVSVDLVDDHDGLLITHRGCVPVPTGGKRHVLQEGVDEAKHRDHGERSLRRLLDWKRAIETL